ncbi:MAG TPA: YiiX/YebB-like N1pC/P60 family cysteine hydrolase, partial [Patescibacteria group bacterium]|nr:YiiX/YebB-like N1pC/P60 family cysteine hydrolase [Patescibacteria group bacterium]
MRKKYFKLINLLPVIFLSLLFISPTSLLAMTPGTLVYRTSGNNMMYGYSTNQLLDIEYGILRHINPGHVGIYIGKDNGEDYVVEALADGIVKTPAKYFVNQDLGEKLLGAKLPIEASALERLKAIKIAKNLAELNYGYDFNFKKQKGAGDGDWTCVGFTEKIYESAGISNPNDLLKLEYNVFEYAVDITPDGYDNTSYVNGDGDTFSRNLEYSKISRRESLLLPASEVTGFNAGREYKGKRYFFVPYTQYLQPTLKNEEIDITLVSSFKEKDIRGKTPVISLMLRWSLINNPLSSIRNIVDKTANGIVNVVKNIFGTSDDEILLADYELLNDKEIKKNSEGQTNPITISKASEERIEIIGENNEINTGKSYNSNQNEIIDVLSGSQDSKIQKKEEKPELQIVTTSKQKDKENKEITTTTKQKVKEVNNNLVVGESKIKSNVSVLVNKLQAAATENKKNISNDDLDIIQNIVPSKVVSGIKPEDATLPDSNSNSSVPSVSPTALISKIYSTGMNDFIELYNPTNYDFDLAESGFRIEKAKTAENPSIAIRIGDEGDGIYPGGTIIKAKGYYLIVRDDASAYFLNMADAIARRSEFGWTGTGYIIYLGKGAISSTSDEDIIDAVGYGDATYFRGQNPALEIADNYYLNRIDDSADNRNDFELAVSSDPSIVFDDYIDDSQDVQDNTDDNEEENTNDNEEEENTDNTEEDDESDINSDFVPYTFAEPIDTTGINDLWHFSECHGEQRYSVGRFGCGLEIGFNNPPFKPELSTNIDLNSFAISFYYRDSKLVPSASPKLVIKMLNESGQAVSISLANKLFQLEGLPNSKWRYYPSPVFSEDNQDWRHFALVVNEEENYWAVYFNGQETYREE